MKSKKILSLLLAITVMATMLMALPLTANAADSSFTVASGTTATNGTYFINDDNVSLQAIVSDTCTAAVAAASASYIGYSYGMPFRTQLGSNLSSSISDPLDGTSISTYYSGNFLCLYLTAKVSGTAHIYIGANGSRTVYAFDNTTGSDATSVSTTNNGNWELLDVTFDAEAGHSYIIYGRKFGAQFYEATYTPDSTSPTISFEDDEVKITSDGSTTLTPTLENVDDVDYSISWSSDNVGVATVDEDGLVSAVSEGTANITASLIVDTSTVSTATCKVTVSDVASVAVTLADTMTSITLSGDKDYTVTESETIEVDPGTYTISGVSGAPVTHGFTLSDTELTAEAGGTYTITSSRTIIDSSLSTDYSKLYGNTITFDVESGSPASAQKINLEGANMADVATDTDGVYLKVDTTTKTEETVPSDVTWSSVSSTKGKFNSAKGVTSAQTRRYTTLIYVPVVPGSVITTTSQSSLFTCSDSDVTVSGQTFTYNGTEETTIMLYINSSSDDYLKKLTIVSPEAPTGTFGTGEADSGYYTSSEQTVGVIRFLQSYAGDTTTGYGFYFVNGETGNITVGVSGALGADGFYADLYGISENDETTYSAIPYVTYSTGTITGDTISGSVDWTRNVDYEESAD